MVCIGKFLVIQLKFVCSILCSHISPCRIQYSFFKNFESLFDVFLSIVLAKIWYDFGVFWGLWNFVISCFEAQLLFHKLLPQIPFICLFWWIS